MQDSPVLVSRFSLEKLTAGFTFMAAPHSANCKHEKTLLTKATAWEWTLLLGMFNNEILAHQATPIPGSNKPFYHSLEKLKQLAGKKGSEPVGCFLLSEQSRGCS